MTILYITYLLISLGVAIIAYIKGYNKGYDHAIGDIEDRLHDPDTIARLTSSPYEDND